MIAMRNSILLLMGLQCLLAVDAASLRGRVGARDITCPVCTFINDAADAYCQMCMSKLPDNVQANIEMEEEPGVTVEEFTRAGIQLEAAKNYAQNAFDMGVKQLMEFFETDRDSFDEFCKDNLGMSEGDITTLKTFYDRGYWKLEKETKSWNGAISAQEARFYFQHQGHLGRREVGDWNKSSDGLKYPDTVDVDGFAKQAKPYEGSFDLGVGDYVKIDFAGRDSKSDGEYAHGYVRFAYPSDTPVENMAGQMDPSLLVNEGRDKGKIGQGKKAKLAYGTISGAYIVEGKGWRFELKDVSDYRFYGNCLKKVSQQDFDEAKAKFEEAKAKFEEAKALSGGHGKKNNGAAHRESPSQPQLPYITHNYGDQFGVPLQTFRLPPNEATKNGIAGLRFALIPARGDGACALHSTFATTTDQNGDLYQNNAKESFAADLMQLAERVQVANGQGKNLEPFDATVITTVQELIELLVSRGITAEVAVPNLAAEIAGLARSSPRYNDKMLELRTQQRNLDYWKVLQDNLGPEAVERLRNLQQTSDFKRQIQQFRDAGVIARFKSFVESLTDNHFETFAKFIGETGIDQHAGQDLNAWNVSAVKAKLDRFQNKQWKNDDWLTLSYLLYKADSQGNWSFFSNVGVKQNQPVFLENFRGQIAQEVNAANALHELLQFHEQVIAKTAEIAARSVEFKAACRELDVIAAYSTLVTKNAYFLEDAELALAMSLARKRPEEAQAGSPVPTALVMMNDWHADPVVIRYNEATQTYISVHQDANDEYPGVDFNQLVADERTRFILNTGGSHYDRLELLAIGRPQGNQVHVQAAMVSERRVNEARALFEGFGVTKGMTPHDIFEHMAKTSVDGLILNTSVAYLVVLLNTFLKNRANMQQ